MPIRGDVQAFRLSIIDQLSRTRFARAVGDHGGAHVAFDTRLDLAASLGVTEEVLVEAGRLSGLAIVNAEAHQADQVMVVMTVPISAKETFLEIHALAAELKLGGKLGGLLRALCHTVMLSEREPAPRPWGDWDARPGKRRRAPSQKQREMSLPFAKHHGKGGREYGYYYITMRCKPGLSFALEARAQALGLSRQEYLRWWMLALLDGDLADVTFVPVGMRATYARPEHYVLPVRPKAEDLPEAGPVAPSERLPHRPPPDPRLPPQPGPPPDTIERHLERKRVRAELAQKRGSG